MGLLSVPRRTRKNDFVCCWIWMDPMTIPEESWTLYKIPFTEAYGCKALKWFETLVAVKRWACRIAGVKQHEGIWRPSPLGPVWMERRLYHGGVLRVAIVQDLRQERAEDVDTTKILQQIEALLNASAARCPQVSTVVFDGRERSPRHGPYLPNSRPRH